jgi:hypothetical protein
MGLRVPGFEHGETRRPTPATVGQIAVPTEEEISACREWLERVVDIDCRSGLYDEAAILGALEDIIEAELGEPSPALYDEAAARVKVGLEARAREEATWRERTVNDRIDGAFEDLDARGIVAAQALGFTVQEGAYLLDEKCAERGERVRGSVFYHRQDLERGVEGGGLALAFTGYGPDRGATEAIGREIVHVLQHHGLPVRWNGSPRTRIEIEPFVWQKRRVTKAPPGATAAPPLPPIPQPPAACSTCRGRGWVATGDPATPAVPCACTRSGAGR